MEANHTTKTCTAINLQPVRLETASTVTEALSLSTTDTSLKPASDTESLPYWLVNVPREKWPSSCPEYLKGQSEKNIEILSTPDEKYQWIGWEKVKELVRQ